MIKVMLAGNRLSAVSGSGHADIDNNPRKDSLSRTCLDLQTIKVLKLDPKLEIIVSIFFTTIPV